MARKDIEYADLTVICDTREQTPLKLDPMAVERGTLATGDYSIKGLEHLIAIERKSLPDLIMCVGQERERFEKECQRLLAYETRAIVVEAHWADIECGYWRSKLTPSHVLGSVLGWVAQGIPILMVGSHDLAGKYVARMLFIAARRRFRELQSMCDGLKIVS